MRSYFERSAYRWTKDRSYKQLAGAVVADQFFPQSKYDVWKWWKRKFGKERDFPEMTRQLVGELLRRYAKGNKRVREVTLQILRLNENTNMRSPRKLLEMLRSERNCQWILPEQFTLDPPRIRKTLTPAGLNYRYPHFPIRANGKVMIDLRRDFAKMKSRLIKCFHDYATDANHLPVSAVGIGFYLCQRGWARIYFDVREQTVRDGEWTRFDESDYMKISQWKRSHDTMQKCGGSLILPNGKSLHVTPEVSCERLAKIYGTMIKMALLDAIKTASFGKIRKHEEWQIQVEEFDGMWDWSRTIKS